MSLHSAGKVLEFLSSATLEGFRSDNCSCSMRFYNDKDADCFYLVAQELVALRPDHILARLDETALHFPSVADFEVSKVSFLLAMAQGQGISDAQITENAGLRLMFPDDVMFEVSAEIPIVDWMWCISRYETDPYKKPAIFACFTPGEIEEDFGRHYTTQSKQ